MAHAPRPTAFSSIVARRQTSADNQPVPELSITLAVTIVSFGWVRAITVSLPIAFAAGILLAGRAAVWQTTLKSAWAWSLAALVAWASFEVAAALRPQNGSSQVSAALRFLAISLSLCPIIALLGAKRPQAGMWNLVVLSLWGILALPALETLLLRPAQPLNLGVVRGVFVAIPVALVLLNYGATRFWFAAMLLAAGQLLALSIYWLPRLGLSHELRSVLALACAAGSLLAARLAPRPVAAAGPDRLWLDFRDCMGTFWALRVAERMNASAHQHHWNVTLRWNGFQVNNASSEPLPPVALFAPAALNTFRGLLRRFVSSDWIDERLEKK